MPLAMTAPAPYHQQMTMIADILVAGPGAAGLTTAIGLAQSGYRVIVAGMPDTRPGTRTIALFEGSLKFLAALGVRETVEAHGQPLAVMRLADDTGSIFRRPPVEFRAAELGRESFGYNVENAVLTSLLLERAKSLESLTFLASPVESYDFAAENVTAHLSDGHTISARLLAAADGANSRARKAAGIKTQTWNYGQIAITAVLGHSLDHHNVSTEYHTREGPCTFVPLPVQLGHDHASSLVWLMTPAQAERRKGLQQADLAREIEKAAHHILGEVKLLRPINTYLIHGLAARRLTAPRMALIGEAAHVLPPIGAQGLNLGLRDAAHLCEVLEIPVADPGAPEVTQEYQRLRMPDVASRTFGVDALNRALLNHILPIDLLRGIGISALAAIGPLRRRIMQEGMSPQWGAPRVMRETTATNRRLYERV